MTPPRLGETITPDASLAADFDVAYAKFRAAYAGIKAVQ